MAEPRTDAIPLGSGKALNSLDISRALLCSRAVYAETVLDAERLYCEAQRSNTGLTFEKVHMSLESGLQKFLVAYAADAIFLAFRGSASLEDVASNLQAEAMRNRGGSFHAGFFKRTDIFGGSGHNPLKELVRNQGKRLIFCGHSLGGAVSHLTLLRFLWDPACVPPEMLVHDQFEKDLADSFISIAFGAPHICDSVLADEVKDSGLGWRFINIVNQDDPVPLLLHDLPGLVKSAFDAAKPVLKDATNSLLALGGFIGHSVSGYATGGVAGAVRGAIKALTSPTADRLNLAYTLTEQWANSVQNIELSDVPKGQRFAPIGQYVLMHKDLGVWTSICLPAGSKPLHLHLGQGPLLQDGPLHHHTLDGYSTALAACRLIQAGLPAMDTQVSSTEEKFVVSCPGPQVQFAKLKVTDTNQRYLHIKGSNLLFLTSRVSLNGTEDWQTKVQTDNELKVFEAVSPLQAGQRRTSAMETIRIAIVKTAFGQTEAAVVEDFQVGETQIERAGVLGSFPKCIQTMLVKAQPPLSLKPSPSDLEMLDNIMSCIPASKGSSFTKSIQVISSSRQGPDANRTEIRNVNKMVQKAITFLSGGFSIQYDPRALEIGGVGIAAIGLVALAGGAVVATAGAGLFYLGYATSLALAGSAAGVAGGGAAATVAGVGLTVTGVALGKSEFLIDSYVDVLKLAVNEARLWTPEYKPDEELPKDEDAQLLSLEQELGKLVVKSTDFARLVDKPNGALPTFKYKLLLGSTEETRRNLLRRIKMIVAATKLYKPIKSTRFVGIVGAEDAGKSTFIKKVMLAKGVKSKTTPAVGDHLHTRVVFPYEITESLWLVDFPGGNGLGDYADSWQQFTSLPSSAILLLHFNNDIKTEHVEMYNNMKKSLETSHLIVAFNRVDDKFGRADRPCPDDYFDELKKKAVEALKCTASEVHYVCLDPEVPEKWERLKKLGVLDFEQFAKLAIVGLEF